MDLTNRTLTQRIGPELADPAAQKLVQIEIVALHNPERKRVSFEVHYEPDDGERVLLGTFGLYPPDNPGKFLVATRGRLRREGAIVVSMQVLDEVEPDDELQVKLKRVSFRTE